MPGKTSSIAFQKPSAPSPTASDQLHGIVNRLDRIEGSIAIVDSHVGALTVEVHRFGERLDRYDERFDRLEQLLRGRPAPS